MLESITAFLESMIDQASDREKNCYRTVEDYLVRRRENIGVRSVLVPVELGLELPDEVFYHPSVVELASHVVELVIIDNVSLPVHLMTTSLMSMPRRTSRRSTRSKPSETTAITSLP